MIGQISREILGSDRILIVTHINPDGDAIGSSLGLYLSLKEMGKTSFLLYESEPPELFGFLDGIEEALLGIDPSELNPGLIISVDAAAQNRVAPCIDKLRPHIKLINIDHHPTNPNFGDINLVSASANSTSSIIFQIMKSTGYTPSHKPSKAFFTGLVTDTGCFRFEGVNS